MPLPVGDQADQQVGAAQQRRVGRHPAAEGEVVAAAGAGVEAVEVELLGGQPGLAGLVVQRGGEVALLGPAGRGLHVDLDDAGVGRDDELGQPRVGRRAVALEHDRAADLAGGDLDQAQQVGVVVEPVGRRQEHVDVAVAGLEGQRGRAGALGVDDGDDRDLRLERLAGLDVRRLAGERGVLPGHGVERQAQADRRRAGQQHEPAAAEPPGGADPLLAGDDRQHPAGGRVDLGVEHAEAVGVELVGGLVGPLAGGLADLGGQRGQGILEGRAAAGRRAGRAPWSPGGPAPRRRRRRRGSPVAVRRPRVGEQGRVAPQRLAVGAPLQGDVPARERLAGVPLALAAVDDAAPGVGLAQPLGDDGGERALLGAVGVGAPLRAWWRRRARRTSARRPWSAGRRRPRAARRRPRRARRSGPTARRCRAG